MDYEFSSYQEQDALFKKDINSFHVNIEDTKVSLFADSGIRNLYSNPNADEFPLHFHPHYELFYADEGQLKVIVQEEQIFLDQYDLIVIPPQIEHISMQAKGKGHRYNIKFHIQHNGLLVDTPLFQLLHTAFLQPYVIIRNCQLFKESIMNLQNCILSQNKLYASYYFLKFAIQFLSLNPTITGAPPKKSVHMESDIMRFHTISSVINEHFKDNVTLEQLAKLLNLSVRQTNRTIKSCYGVSFSTLMLENKMLYAANLLVISNLSVTEIAKKTGYSSLKGFYHSFKKKYDCLPSEYRKLYSSEKRAEVPMKNAQD